MKWAWIALVALGAVLYANALSNSFVFDDVDAIVENPHLQSLQLPAALGAPAGSGASGRPLVALSLAINHAVGGRDPRGYRAFNIAILVLCSGVLLQLLRANGVSMGWAFAAAAIWLVHPLNTSVIDHVVYRNEILAGLFLLVTLGCVHRAAVGPQSRLFSALAILACAAGMASKETMVGAPFLALLYDSLFLSGSARLALRRRPGLYVGLACTWLVLWACVASGDRGTSVTTHFADLSRLAYARTELGVIAHYVRLAFWPRPLVLDYDWPIAAGWGSVALSTVLVLGTVLWTLVAVWRHRKVAFFGAAFFAVLAPSSSFVPLTGAVAMEHRMVMPLVSVVVLFLLAARAGLTRFGLPRPAQITLAVMIIAGLASMTIARNRDYATVTGIWADTARKAPRNPRAHGNLGAALLQQGMVAESIEPLATALRLQPDFAAAHRNLALAHQRLGLKLAAAGQADSAVTHLRSALALDTNDIAARNALAWVLATTTDPAVRDPQTALEEARRVVVAAAPEPRAEYLDTLAAALASTGDFEAAQVQATTARDAASRAGQTELAARIEVHRASYANNRPMTSEATPRP